MSGFDDSGDEFCIRCIVNEATVFADSDGGVQLGWCQDCWGDALWHHGDAWDEDSSW